MKDLVVLMAVHSRCGKLENRSSAFRSISRGPSPFLTTVSRTLCGLRVPPLVMIGRTIIIEIRFTENLRFGITPRPCQRVLGRECSRAGESSKRRSV